MIDKNARIPKGQAPFTLNGDEYLLSPLGIILLCAEWLHPTKPTAEPEKAVTIKRCNYLVQAVVRKAEENGCTDWQHWADQLTAPDNKTRAQAADELIHHLTQAEYDAIVQRMASC
jgi:hypothetical protein